VVLFMMSIGGFEPTRSGFDYKAKADGSTPIDYSQLPK